MKRHLLNSVATRIFCPWPTSEWEVEWLADDLRGELLVGVQVPPPDDDEVVGPNGIMIGQLREAKRLLTESEHHMRWDAHEHMRRAV